MRGLLGSPNRILTSADNGAKQHPFQLLKKKAGKEKSCKQRGLRVEGRVEFSSFDPKTRRRLQLYSTYRVLLKLGPICCLRGLF